MARYAAERRTHSGHSKPAEAGLSARLIESRIEAVVSPETTATSSKTAASKTAGTNAAAKASACHSGVAAGELARAEGVEYHRVARHAELRIAVCTRHHSHSLILLRLQHLKVLPELLTLLSCIQLRSDESEVVVEA